VRRKYLAVIALAVFVCLALSSYSARYAFVESALSGPQGAPDRPCVERLLQRAVAEQPRLDAANPLVRFELTWTVMNAFTAHHHPVGKLLRYGGAAIKPLLEIAQDQQYDPECRCYAWHILTCFDDPAIPRALVSDCSRGLPPPGGADFVLIAMLPVMLVDSQYTGPQGVTRIGRLLLEKSHDEAYLTLLDKLVDSPLLGPSDPHVLRWLNRYYGDDLDDWIAQQSKSVSDFRERAFALGYDPLTIFSGVRYPVFLAQRSDTGSIWPDKNDARACAHLLTLCPFVSSGPAAEGGPRHPPEEGWRDRLRKWYKDNRAVLRYDFRRHRFVTGK
jgi:hypothetical protein